MQLNNTSKYAIRILSYIANKNDKQLHSAKELSDSLEISYKFLTKIMTELVKAEFVISIQGREGGFKLAKPAASITIMDILNQFNESLSSKECILGIDACNSKNRCFLHDQWVKPQRMMIKMFENTTLENLEGTNFKL